MKTLSLKIKHFFHVLSNVRPVVWILMYLAFMPAFAVVYGLLPAGQFRIPDNAGTDFGSWLYYSIVTITTLGFGDYTPAHGWAQAVTAIEVMCGLVVLGFFLNAVGSMKSEIDVESELEKQKLVHQAQEKEKLRRNIPILIHKLNLFMAYCYAVTTPKEKQKSGDDKEYNPDFKFQDLKDMYKPSGLPGDKSMQPAIEGLLRCASNTSLYLDSLETHVDLTLWPELLEDCFSFVANCQMFGATDSLSKALSVISERDNVDKKEAEHKIVDEISSYTGSIDSKTESNLAPIIELYHFIKRNADLARKMEVIATKLSVQ